MSANRRGRQPQTTDERHMLVLLPRLGATTTWHAIVFRRDGSQFNIVAERDSAAGDGGMASWLSTWTPHVAAVLLPANAAICRTCPLPRAEGSQLESALRLHAETAVLGGSINHRVAMSPLPPATGDSKAARQGVIFAWPESNSLPTLPNLPSAIDIRYVPLPAAILGLLGGLPPERPVVRVDRHDGSILFMLTRPEGILIRSTRDDPSDESSWQSAVMHATAETLLNADCGAEEIRSLQGDLTPRLASGAFLMLPPSAAERLERQLPGARTGDAARDAERAIALGAVLLLDGPLAPLASMREVKVAVATNPIDQIAAEFSTPKRAALVVGIAVGLIMLAPLAAASVRWAILRAKLPDAAQYDRLNRITKQKVAVYSALADASWPMTKLLGDLANSLPEGIEIETLQVSTGDGVTLRGIARSASEKLPDGKSEARSPSDVIIAMEKKLRETGIFANLDYKYDPPQASGRSFTLTCKVTKPTRVVEWAEADDFGKTDLRTRKYPDWKQVEGSSGGRAVADAGNSTEGPEPSANANGRTARATPPPPPAPPRTTPPATAPPEDGAKPADTALADAEGAAEGAAPPDRGIGRRRSGDGSSAEGAGADGKPGESKPAQPAAANSNVEIPGPFTDEEIKALSKGEAQALLGKISRARQLPGLETEVAERLKQDFTRVLNQAKSAS